MSNSYARAFRGAICAGVAMMALAPSLAFAQEAPAADGAGAPDTDEIVVTGTLLRGAPPVGSNLISVGQDKIASTGSTTANELLASIPQVSNFFNTVPNSQLSIASNQLQVVRPNLRNLAGVTSSSASTLVLFDGHRISPVGVTQNAVDPDIIPSIAIERVEVVTDGGSSTYGSDAVGGVINFITRKRYDGVKVQAHYGFADNYDQYDAGIIAGKDWGSGSIFAAYNYQHNSALFGRDRDFIRSVDFLSPNLTPTGRSCSPGNVQIGGNLFALPNLTSTTPNACDPSDDTNVVPESTRHSALIGLHQELADWLTVDLRGFYGERKAVNYSPFRGGASVPGGAPTDLSGLFGRPPGTILIPGAPRAFYYTPVPGQAPDAAQTVFFTLAPLLGRNSARSTSEFQEWGANAEFAAKLGGDWQLRSLFNYSRSNSEFHIEQLSPSLFNAFASGTTAATSINFYNPGSGAFDAANIAKLVNSELAGQGKEELLDLRAILDGTLFTLPGGGVKLAVGYEHMFDRFQQRTVNDGLITPVSTLSTTPFAEYHRHVDSLFGELQVPLVGADNRMGFIYALTLDGSVRYDRYSDFGSTVNPKIGVNFKPVSWLGFRGNYSTSFNAPSPNDQLGALRSNVNFFPINAFVRPGDHPTATGTIGLQGSNAGLTPQTAKTWSVGMDFDPDFFSGFHASVNYYNVKFKNIISIPTPGPGIFANFPNNVTAVVGGLPLSTVHDLLFPNGVAIAPGADTTYATVVAGCTNPAACPNVYEFTDFRQGNYGTLNIQGLDFSANYQMQTGFGGIDASVAGNYVLSRKSQTGLGAPIIDELQATNIIFAGVPLQSNASSRLQLSLSVGADFGKVFRAQATLNHSSGYAVVRCDATTTPACLPTTTGIPSSSGLPQDRVGAFDTVNLFFKYDVPSDGLWLKDLELTLNINNVFDTDPPIYRLIGGNTGAGYANGFTLGRLVQFGIQKKF